MAEGRRRCRRTPWYGPCGTYCSRDLSIFQGEGRGEAAKKGAARDEVDRRVVGLGAGRGYGVWVVPRSRQKFRTITDALLSFLV